ncbi:MAG: SRPBCC family protein [Planctomycetota bacterium]
MHAPDPTDTSDREIVTTRLLDAPRELVWQAWTHPEHVAHWFGPTGFTLSTQAMEVRVGGQWRFVMHGPDGTDYPNRITYVEVTPPERLVYRHGGEVGAEPVDFTTTVTFEDVPGPTRRTRLTMRAVFASPDAREFVAREYGAVEGGQQTVARLAEHLDRLQHAPGGSAPFVIRRVVAAPPESVFRLWTEREHLAQWFGPKGCTLDAKVLQLRPGGVFHYRMSWQGGQEMWGKWCFEVIEAPTRLVFVSSFSDPEQKTCRSPFAAEWPLEMRTEARFEPHAGKGGGTVITLTTSAIAANATEQRTFDDGHASMTGGWGGTFEQLDAYVARL